MKAQDTLESKRKGIFSKDNNKVIREIIINQRRMRKKVQPSKLNLLHDFNNKKGVNIDNLKFTRYVDPPHINKEGDISVSEKFKQRIKNTNFDLLSRFNRSRESTTGFSHYRNLKKRFDDILRSPLKPHQSFHNLNSRNHERNNGKRLNQMMKLYCNTGFKTEEKVDQDWGKSKDHPFWTKSQHRILNKKTFEDEKEDSKSYSKDIKPLDLSKLRRPYLPDVKYKKLFEDERMITNIKNKYFLKTFEARGDKDSVDAKNDKEVLK
ncbi:unnamed protein product [Moneuplotes crassus]|uniref:Uncharacterized protein n=1 Tax=Euplotes crassus TaxID=5936 RepID=A0AAD1XTA9_EUPCR|nr:unnamed protein product [Moneuplotes crassus]